MQASRRSFLLSLLGLAVASGGTLAFYGHRRRSRDPERFVADLVRRRLEYLDIEDADLDRFARDFLARCEPAEREQVRRLASERSLLSSLLRSADAPSSVERWKLERTIAACFLLATDFFHQSREPESVTYVAFPDPYELGCANPLARRIETVSNRFHRGGLALG